MGDLVLKGATSGQITVTPTAIAGTNTLTLPAKTGNIITSADSGTVTQAMLASGVAGNGPVFSAYTNATQTLTNGSTQYTVAFDQVYFNQGSQYSTSTYTFTPTTAGYYQINASLYFAAGSTSVFTFTLIRSSASYIEFGRSSGTGNTFSGSVIAYANGTTDNFKLYALSTVAGATVASTSALGNFSATLVRAA